MYQTQTMPHIKHHRWQPWLLVAVLLVAQLLLSVHTLEHLDDAPGTSCDICLVGHGLGHAPTVQHLSLATAGPPPRHPVSDTISGPSRATPTPCQRGPPARLRFA